jgi:hypothetical protein
MNTDPDNKIYQQFITSPVLVVFVNRVKIRSKYPKQKPDNDNIIYINFAYLLKKNMKNLLFLS